MIQKILNLTQHEQIVIGRILKVIMFLTLILIIRVYFFGV